MLSGPTLAAAMLPGRNGKPQLVRFGYKGVADIIGIEPYRPFVRCEKDSSPFAGIPGLDTPLPTYKRGDEIVGRFFAIEVKAPKGKQSDEQASFQKAVENAGGIYILARSLEDVQKVIG